MPVDGTIYTDASLDGSGPVFGKSANVDTWIKQEQKLHINVFKLLGVNKGFS